jgi:hypothetical protein
MRDAVVSSGDCGWRVEARIQQLAAHMMSAARPVIGQSDPKIDRFWSGGSKLALTSGSQLVV